MAEVGPQIVVESSNARGGCDAIQGSGRSDAARAEGGAVVIQPAGSSTRPPYDGAQTLAASGSPETAA